MYRDEFLPCGSISDTIEYNAITSIIIYLYADSARSVTAFFNCNNIFTVTWLLVFFQWKSLFILPHFLIFRVKFSDTFVNIKLAKENFQFFIQFL